MIEIIRQEENEKKKKTLPKDIRQIGKADAGDRIYVENQVYHFLHTPEQEEKSAYVLLGKFEEFSGKYCVFVESAIRLTKMQFEGGLPLWTDRTWAYIFKHLNKEHDDMAIVGCAIDIRGQQPGMTVKLEAIHQKNFGGPHQVMFLMDTLEQDESFYGNYNGHLYKKEGFYIYYDKNLPGNISMSVRETVEEEGELEKKSKDAELLLEKTEPLMEKAETESPKAEMSLEKAEMKSKAQEPEQNLQAAEWKQEPPTGEKTAREIKLEDFNGRQSSRRFQSSSYRERLKAAKAKKRPAYSSYAPTVALAALICLMGAAAIQNQKKVTEIENTLSYNGSTENQAEQQQEAGENNVVIETVGGNVQPQDEAAAGDAFTDDTENIGSDAQTVGVGGGESADMENTLNEQQDQTLAEEMTEGQQGQTLAEKTTNEQQTTDAAETGTTETKATETGATETAANMAASDAVKSEAQIYLEQGYYIVQKGDNLASICRKIYQTTAMMDKICEINQIEDKNAIYAGQYLVLPN